MKHSRVPALGLAAAILWLSACSASGASPLGAVSAAEPPGAFSRGRISEKNVYVSDFAGIRIRLPDDWVLSPDEELAEAMDIDPEQLQDEERFPAQAEELPMIYDLMAGSAQGTQTLVVMIEPLGGAEAGPRQTAAEYLDAWADRLAALQSISYELDDPREARLADLDFQALDAWVPQYGVYQSYYVRKVGNYMLCLVFTNTASPAIGGLASCFEAASERRT